MGFRFWILNWWCLLFHQKYWIVVGEMKVWKMYVNCAKCGRHFEKDVHLHDC